MKSTFKILLRVIVLMMLSYSVFIGFLTMTGEIHYSLASILYLFLMYIVSLEGEKK